MDEGAWVQQRDAEDGAGPRGLARGELARSHGICGSGGGLRAATALAGFLAEAHACGLLDATTYLSGVSGSCWTLSALYAEDAFDPANSRKYSGTRREGPASPGVGLARGQRLRTKLLRVPRFAAR